MAVCPNCGSANSEGIKFCVNCGSPLAVSQPVQPQAQPVQTQQAQPVYQQPVHQPQYQQPVYQQPVYQQPVYQQPVQPVQPVYVQPVVQPVKSEPAVKTNGFCKAGFVLSLIGLFVFGITSLFGLIFSIVGLITVGKKKQDGKGKAIAGIVMSVIMLIVMTLGYVFIKSDTFSDIFDSSTDTTRSTRTTKETTTTTAEDIITVDYEKLITTNSWVIAEDETFLVFNRSDKSFKYYDYQGSENYSAGHYEICFAKEARDKLINDFGDCSMTEDELRTAIKSNDLYGKENLFALILTYEEESEDGEVQMNEDPFDVHFYGFYTQPELNGKTVDILDTFNLDSEQTVTLVLEAQYGEYGSSSSVLPSESTENTTSDDDSIVGDSLSGTITLTQGTWDYWHEADGMDDYYESRYQRINRDTETILCVAVLSGNYDDGSAKAYAEIYKSAMESDSFFNITMEETKIGGHDAYTVTGQYQDGMYLTIWYFVDSHNRLHYISVEYYPDDYVSYEMVRDTYTLDR